MYDRVTLTCPSLLTAGAISTPMLLSIVVAISHIITMCVRRVTYPSSCPQPRGLTFLIPKPYLLICHRVTSHWNINWQEITSRNHMPASPSHHIRTLAAIYIHQYIIYILWCAANRNGYLPLRQIDCWTYWNLLYHLSTGLRYVLAWDAYYGTPVLF